MARADKQQRERDQVRRFLRIAHVELGLADPERLGVSSVARDPPDVDVTDSSGRIVAQFEVTAPTRDGPEVVGRERWQNRRAIDAAQRGDRMPPRVSRYRDAPMRESITRIVDDKLPKLRHARWKPSALRVLLIVINPVDADPGVWSEQLQPLPGVSDVRFDPAGAVHHIWIFSEQNDQTARVDSGALRRR